MGDAILIRDLRVLARCGALPEEHERPQPFDIDLDVFTDMARASETDDLADTIDYGELTAAVVARVTTGHVTLLERLAAVIAEVVLADERVSGVTVEARKVRPPLPHDVATTGVRITRGRT